MADTTIGQICALLTAVCWSSSLILFKRSGETLSPVALNLFKNVIGLILMVLTLLIVAAVSGGELDRLADVSTDDMLLLVLSGFVGIAVADSIFLHSLNLIGVGIQSIVDCVYCLFVILFSWILLADTPTASLYVGAAMILGGVFICSRHAPPADRTRSQLTAGVLLGVFSIGLMAIGIVVIKPVLDPPMMNFPLISATVLRLIGGTVPLLLWAAASRHRRKLFAGFRPGPVWKWAVPGAFLGAYLSMLLWIAGFKYTQAAIAGILNQTSTIFAVLLAAMFLGETLTKRKLLAMSLALGGVVVVTVGDALSK